MKAKKHFLDMKAWTAVLAVSIALLSFCLVACNDGMPGTVNTSVDRPDDGSLLPFPTPPMGGSVGNTMQESLHKWRVGPPRRLF